MTTLEEKLEALRNLATSARKLGNVHEAEAAELAAKKIAARMASDPKAHASVSDMGQDEDPLFWTDLPMRSWPFHLASLVAKATGVELLADDTDRRGSSWHYVPDRPARWRAVYFGTTEDRRDAKILFDEMKKTVKEATRMRSFASQRTKEAYALRVADQLGRSLRCNDPEKRRTIEMRRKRAHKAALELATPVRDPRPRRDPFERVTVRHNRR